MLIHEAKAVNRQTGRYRLKDCARYAVLLSFKRKLDAARRHLACFLEKTGKPVIACGGGKDSTAVAILARSLDPEIPIVCGDPPNPLADREKHTRELFAWLGGPVHRVPYAWNVQDVLSGVKPYPEGLKQRILAKWHADHGVDGVIFGIRTQESRSRRLHFRHKGFVYQTRAGWRCQPLALFTAEEALCVALMHDAPVNPVYEKQKGELDFNLIHDGTWWPHGIYDTSQWLREYYPEHYEDHKKARTVYNSRLSAICQF